MFPEDPSLGIIGLGYVGLPLALAFGARFRTIGYDLRPERVAQLRDGIDCTRESEPAAFEAARRLSVTTDPAELAGLDVYIVTVPTPIDRFRRPDLSALEAASRTVGRALRPGAVVVYESTVYPGATEEFCAPLLEQESGLALNRDFWVGYSPERINPGDKTHRLETICKVTSGSTPDAADFIDRLYAAVVTAGTYRASSIRVAEAAKVIENTQRDVNIALINELAMLFNRLGLDTQEVLAAAGTKWNFLPFRPGLVGGHCIGVDPYYLTHKAQEIGFHADMILAGRRINDHMGHYVAEQVVKLMTQRGTAVKGARVLVLGLAFKENCPDLRNSRVTDIIGELAGFGVAVDVHDPWVDPGEAERAYGIVPVASPAAARYDGIVVAVAHREFTALGAVAIRAFGRPGALLYDVKGVFPADQVDARL